MKTRTFKVTDAGGRNYPWTFQYLTRVYSTLGRYMDGWLLISHDGCERFHEGNWRDFVPFVRTVARNYAFTTRLS